MKKYISLFIFFALSLSAFAQTAGGEWKWARAFGGTDGSTPGNSIKQVEYDADGNTYIVGVYGQFGCWDDGQPIVNNSTVSAGNQTKLLVAKFDSVGTLLWSRVVQNSYKATRSVIIQLTDS
ncbi:MAG: hypothetical protein KBT28_07155, partial [Bacteroidales bacterium]|nr:hypothetical protein [Candidatus Colimorpha merdihippi]